MSGAAFGRVEVRYGLVEWVKTPLGFFLLFVLTFFLCLGISNGNWHGEFHLDVDKPNNEPTVTVSPSFVSISADILDNSNTVLVVSNSSVPVDAEVITNDGRYLFTYSGLMPGCSFYFEYEEPCTITAVVS